MSEKDYLRGRSFWVKGARWRRSGSSRSTSSPMSRARAPVGFGGGSRGARAPLQVCKSRFGGYAWAGARQGAFAHDFATSTASSSAFDALNTFGATPRGARRAMDSEGDGRRDPTPKTARERARSPRRGARDGDAGVKSRNATKSPITSCRFGRGRSELSREVGRRSGPAPATRSLRPPWWAASGRDDRATNSERTINPRNGARARVGSPCGMVVVDRALCLDER